MRYLSLALLTTIAILTASYTFTHTAVKDRIRIHNDIKNLLELKDEPFIQQLAPLIKTCDVYVNDKHISTGQTRSIPIKDQQCTINIVSRLQHFNPIFPKFSGYLRFLINTVERWIWGCLNFTHTLDIEDLHCVNDDIRISNIIIDRIATIDDFGKLDPKISLDKLTIKITI